MPLYDYRCRKCGHEFEALVIGSATPECPQCGGSELDKLMSTFAFRSSGGGTSSASGSGSGCSGCAGGNCSSCH